MSISQKTRVILVARGGGKCAFADCREDVVERVEEKDEFVITGEAAHIVAQQEDGPRGSHPFDRAKIDEYENLILLCERHHKIVDASPAVYPVERLHQIKRDHENWVSSTLSKEQRFTGVKPPENFVADRVQSTLLPVTNIPFWVFIAPCELDEQEVKGEIHTPEKAEIMLPYLVREKKLLTFYDTRKYDNPFSRVVDPHSAERHEAVSWWDDPDLCRWYMTLLNRSLNKLTGRRHLNLDKEHGRYYFEPEEGEENGELKTRRVRYRALKGTWTERSVAWRPTFRYKEGAKSYWEHMAVSLRFHRVEKESWCLSIRPERRFTRNGYEPLTPKGTGKRSTSRQSHQYNIDVLKEIQFWREYLSDGSPRILFGFGTQALVVDNEMICTELSWPGVPDDAKSVTNIRHEDDLFTFAELDAVLGSDLDAESDWEEDEFTMPGE